MFLTENIYALSFLGKEVILRLLELESGNGGIIPIVAVQEQFGLMLLVIPETNSDALVSLEFEVNVIVLVILPHSQTKRLLNGFVVRCKS